MKRVKVLSLLAASILLLVAFPIGRQAASYFKPITAQGKYVLLRLEDVGPGGFYGTPEGLGKLRAVLGYLDDQNIPYHITVVSRWKAYHAGKGWEEAGIDTPTPLTKSFVKILQDAQSANAVLGMHGYSHQYGNHVREDGHHNSGFANEFKVKGEPDSETMEYAAERIEKSLAAFEKNGLFPAFWESPHYHATYEQERVFRSYMGIIYEPNWFELRSLKDMVYVENENQWNKESLGSVYIPAPLRYVAGEERIQQILENLKDSKSLGSMYFHPYLEFDYLEVVQENGTTVEADGVPVFRYKTGKASPLHQLIEGIKQTNYTFGTIHDVVPFSPAHRVSLQPGLQTEQILTGDLNGDSKDDWISIDSGKGQINAVFSDLKWPRNSNSQTDQIWLQSEELKQAGIPLLVKQKDNKRSDLLWITSNQVLLLNNQADQFSADVHKSAGADIVQQSNMGALDQWQWISISPAAADASKVVAYNQSLRRAILFQVNENKLVRLSDINLPETLSDKAYLKLTHVNADQYADLVAVDPASLNIWVGNGSANGFEKPSIWGKGEGDYLAGLGDGNGDKLADMVFYNGNNGIWQVLRSTGNHFEKLPAVFGPWARDVKGIPLVGDFDGNGKSDVAMYNEETGTIDIALSYQK